jgi:hypothetical protein
MVPPSKNRRVKGFSRENWKILPACEQKLPKPFQRRSVRAVDARMGSVVSDPKLVERCYP